MIRIKRLHTFVLGTFLPLLLATFSVCLFILLMQFLWQYVNDMVGKGVGIDVLLQLFFYASLSFTPMALPLSILLASLMTFGNLGEHLELLAMKASGISLIRIMKPLICLVVVLVGVSFVFQNNIMPKAQTKMYTIVLSLKHKSPELDIPEGIFYKEITGYNVYVRKKDKKREMLRDIMIYDYSKGFENTVVIVADSGKLKVSDDKKYLALTLYSGESFENLPSKKQRARKLNDPIPYRREIFGVREMLISFDTNFNMEDESVMGSRDIGKNINELTTYIDSVKQEQDSLNEAKSLYFKKNIYLNTFKQNNNFISSKNNSSDSLSFTKFKTHYDELNLDRKIQVLRQAKAKAEQNQTDYDLSMRQQSETLRQLRLHTIQLEKKFTLSLACLLFFFIGAPLGAIIRKGGIGMPVVLSVALFLTYHTIDTFGTKMARQGVWTTWEGSWLSTVILAALGIFFTYKAVNDSTMMNPDTWQKIIQKLTGKKEVRNYSKKDVIMTPPNYDRDIEELIKWNDECKHYLDKHKKNISYISFWKKGLDKQELNLLVESLENIIEDLLNADENLIIGKLMDHPIIQLSNSKTLNSTYIRWFCGIVFPIGLAIYLIAIYKQKQINNDLLLSHKVNESLITESQKIKNGIGLDFKDSPIYNI